MKQKTTNSVSAMLAGACLVALTIAVAPGTALSTTDVTSANVAEKSALASTAADHEALAEYFAAEAKDAERRVALHEKMRNRQRGGKYRFRMQHHCRTLIRAARAEQETYEDLVDLHKHLAAEAGK